MNVMNRLIRGVPLNAQEMRVQEIRDRAIATGFIDAGDAERMLNESVGDVAALVDELARSRPHLLTGSAQMNRRIRQQRSGAEPSTDAEAAPQRPQGGSADAGNAGHASNGSPIDMNDLIRADYWR